MHNLRPIMIVACVLSLMTPAMKAHAEVATTAPAAVAPAPAASATDQTYSQTKRNEKDNDLYMDLAREIDVATREREKKTGGAGDDQVKVLQAQLDDKIKELEVLRKEVSKEVKQKTESNENLKLLVSLYETISADQTAELLKHMPASVSLAVMQMMSPKKASKILAAMDPKVAAELSRRLISSPSLATNNGGVAP